MKCKIIIEPDEDGFCAWEPELPGLAIWGHDEAHARYFARKAIESYLQAQREEEFEDVLDFEYEMRETPTVPKLYLAHENATPLLRRLGYEVIYPECTNAGVTIVWNHTHTDNVIAVNYALGSYFRPRTLAIMLDGLHVPDIVEQYGSYFEATKPDTERDKQDNYEIYADPYTINNEIRELARTLTRNMTLRDPLAVDYICQWMFDWILENITYGASGRLGYGVGARSAQETYWQREGVCCEMSYLFIAMARHVGIECYPVVTGEKVMNPNHMLGGALVDGSFSLFDPAKKKRELYYPKLSIWDDVYCRNKFNTWRGVAWQYFPENERMKYPSHEAQNLTRILQRTHDIKVLRREQTIPQFDVRFAQRLNAENRRQLRAR